MNHEAMFSKYCDCLKKLSLTLGTDNLVDLVKSPLFKDYVFDAYGTVEDLIRNNNDLTLADFECWHDLIEDLPYYEEIYIKERDEYYVVVHAGLIHYDDYKAYKAAGGKLSNDNFFLWARGEEAIAFGGETQAITVHGHTPVFAHPFNLKGKARVMMYQTKNPTKRFINIDCGIAYRDDYKNANIACLRLDDEKAFYLF